MMHHVEWVEPALVWNNRKLPALFRPRIAELTSDDFIPEFISGVSGSAPTTYLQSTLLSSSGNLKLYQPLHGRYYLITASLVCRQMGLPDKAVERNTGESTTFVMRRTVDRTIGDKVVMVEQGWIQDGEQGAWHDLVDAKGRPLKDIKGRPIGLLPNEERFPMHAVMSCSDSDNEDVNDFRPMCSRQVYQGYLPTGNREKYVTYTPYQPANYIETINNVGSGDNEENYLLNEFDSKVMAVWTDWERRGTHADDERKSELAFYWILDFAVYLRDTLPTVWDAVLDNDVTGLPASLSNLFTEIEGITITRSGIGVSLDELMRDYQNHLGMAQGNFAPDGNNPLDSHSFRLPSTADDNLKAAVENALNAEPVPYEMPEEIQALLSEQVRVPPAESDNEEALYFIRLVYEYANEPDCPPVISEASQMFSLAKYFDTDAPARNIRLELPSIKMQDLRKFKAGVGMQMTPELRDVMNRVREDTAEEGLSGGGVSWELGMICTFSLQIIFLVAFIVMFIFLIALNIIFWWLPFLKICFPVPRPSD